MTIFDTPSPMARVIAPDPARWGERFGARQARRSNHPARIYDQDKERNAPTLLLAMSPIEANLVIRSLASSSMAAARELAPLLAAQLRGHDAVWVDTDPTSPHGIERPDGA